VGKIYVLESKYHGSNIQLRGLASVISEENEIISLKCGLRSRKMFWFPFYRLIIAIKRRLGSCSPISSLLTRLVLFNAELFIEKNSIIIAKTAPYEFPAAILAAGNSARIIFIGKARRVPRHFFYKIISTPSSKTENEDCFLEIMPGTFTYQRFKQERSAFFSDFSYWCILLGGKARGYDYSEQDWSILADALIEHAKQAKVQLVISSSPRTGLNAEKILQKKISDNPELVQETIWWRKSSGEKKGTFELMLGASLVLVTEDSASMLSEALNTRLPVIALHPEVLRYNPLTTNLVKYHSEKKSLLRVPISNLKQTNIFQWIHNEWNPVEECWSESLRRQLKTF
jgi:mitochondrial fission protein ELM1